MGLGRTVRGSATCTQVTLQSRVRGPACSEAFYEVSYTPLIKSQSTLARCYFTNKKKNTSHAIGGCHYSTIFQKTFATILPLL